MIKIIKECNAKNEIKIKIDLYCGKVISINIDHFIGWRAVSVLYVFIESIEA